ncbi:MAG: hypothetical protein P4L86_24840, partial [Mycobacterium sp.]|nr:hypothetical protein [Mycobacterium sp.]
LNANGRTIRLNAAFDFGYPTLGSPMQSSVQVTIVEPVIAVALATSVTRVNASTLSTLTITVSQSAGVSTAPAYGLFVTITAAALASSKLALVNGSVVLVSTGGLGSVFVLDGNALAGSTGVNISVPVYRLTDGPLTVTLQVRATDSLTPGEVLTPTVGIAYGSASTDQAALQKAEPQPPIRQYAASAQTTLYSDMSYSYQFVETRTSLAETVSPQVALGEVITYTLTALVPQGTTAGVSVQLSALAAAAGRLSITSAVCTYMPAYITASSGVTTNSTAAPTVAVNPDAGLPDQVTFTLGQVVNRGHGAITRADDYIVFTVTVVVPADSHNTDGVVVKANSAYKFGFTTSPLTDQRAVQIVEPKLVVAMTNTNNTLYSSRCSAFTVVVQHQSSSPVSSGPAYFVRLLVSNLFSPNSLQLTAGSVSSS